MAEGKTYRIPLKHAIGLIILAGIADLLTLIPFVGILVGPTFWLLMGKLYFSKRGIRMMGGKQGTTRLISMIAEVIPVVQELPTIIVGMIVILVMTYLEDKTGLPVSSVAGAGQGGKVSDGIRRPPPIVPANHGGVRAPNGGLTK